MEIVYIYVVQYRSHKPLRGIEYSKYSSETEKLNFNELNEFI